MKIIHEVRRSRGSAAQRGAGALLLLAVSGMLAWAAPQGAKVVQGNVSIASSSNLTTITASNNSIISYTGFNILPAEIVRFIQPAATARVYNEVNSPNPSVIAGQLLANGQVYLFNPSGIVFANGCLVNCGAIYAAAAKLSEQNFLSGVNCFTAASGPVVNNGTIKGQAVVLFGSTVLNTGTILAPKGFVVLAAGNDLYLCEDGSQVMVKLPGAAAAGQGGATNAGGTAAPQSTASLGAGDLYSVLVHNTGTVQAQNITLQSSATGAVKVEGVLDASNTTPGATGGTVNVLGGEVDLVGANINASGAAGGGKVLIGGDLHGQSGTPTAQVATVDQNSIIKADALTAGNGGEVVVWSDLATFCYGQISARGGAQGGNGGFVETSGHYLDAAGALIDTSAPKGSAGTWLLDPYDITIEAASTQNPGSITAGNFTSSGDPSILNVSDLETALGTTNVVVQTGSGGPDQGNITVAAPVTWATATTLTLNAINNVNVNADITGGSLVLSAGNTVSVASAIGLTGSLSVTGNATLSADITTGGGQTYNGPATLGSNAILADSGPGVAFDSTVDGGYSLEVNGNAAFGGAVGSLAALSSLYVTGTTAMNAGTVTTTGDQSYSQLVTLAQDTTLQGGTVQAVSGASLQVAGAGNSLTLTFGGTTVIDGNLISGVNNLIVGDSGITGSATQLLNSITTTGEQEYYDPVTLLGNTTVTSPSSSYAVFFNTVDGGYSLQVNGNAGFGGAVGSLAPLTSLDVTGDAEIEAGTITTSGGQTYTGVVTLYSDTILTDPGQGVAFGSTVDGAYLLEVNGNAAFGGAVGSLAALSSLYVTGTTAMNAGTVTTTGDQSYSQLVTLAQDTTLSGGTVQAVSGTSLQVAGAGNSLTLTFGGTTVIDGNLITGVNNLAVGNSGITGSATQLLNDVTTIGEQDYYDPVTLMGNATLTGTPYMYFYNTVDGAYSLTVNGNSGFGAAVGSLTPLSSLDVTGTTEMYAGAVTTTGDQSYSQLVTLGVDTTLQGGTVQAVSGTPIQVAGGGNSLTLTFGGTTVVDGNLVTGVNNLAVGGSGITGSATQLLNDITTTGEQGYSDPVTLTGNATLTGPSSSYVVFFSTVDGGYSLEVNGNAAFGGAVGSLTPLSILDVTGTTSLRCGSITTSGGQTYTGAVTLYSDTTLTDPGPGIAFGSTVDSVAATPQVPYALTVNGNAAFGGAVGSVGPLSSLDVTGTTAMDAGTVTTTDGQTYGGAVTLSANALLTDTGPGVTFGSTVDSVTATPQTPYVLIVDGNAAFDAAVGSIQPLSGLEVIGTTAMDAGTVTTVGGQIYVGAVTLSSDTTLATGAGNTPDILFGSSINGAYALTLDAGASGNISVAGAIGNENPLTALTIADSNNTSFGASVKAGTITLLNTTNAIIFGGDITATSLITAPQPYSIIFEGSNNTVTNPVKFLNTGGIINGATLLGTLELATAIPNMGPQPVGWFAPTLYLESSALALDEADLEALRNLGVWPRSLTPDEVATPLLDDLLFVNDLPMKVNPDPSDYTVALNRLPDKETQILLAQYRDIFWKGGLDQADAVRASFEQALADFRKLGTSFTPVNFAQYVQGQNGDARQNGAGIKSLLSGLRSLGLTRRDFEAAKESLLNRVRPAGLSITDFERFIEGL